MHLIVSRANEGEEKNEKKLEGIRSSCCENEKFRMNRKSHAKG